MPGETQIVEGKVELKMIDVRFTSMALVYNDVPGLQEALEKWVGRKVSIIIEDVTE